MAQSVVVTPEKLVEQARAARQLAYAPYSNYFVGAAVLAEDGTIVLGCNVENASYPATICAERVALTAAIAQGKRTFTAIAVATRDGGSPCGICRQVMAELGLEMKVYITDEQGNFRATTVRELLPDSFSGNSLLS
jgi:cytidine deaminase